MNQRLWAETVRYRRVLNQEYAMPEELRAAMKS